MLRQKGRARASLVSPILFKRAACLPRRDAPALPAASSSTHRAINPSTSHLSCPRLHCHCHAMALDDACAYDCCALPPPLHCLDWDWDSELLHTHRHTTSAGGAAVQAEPPTFFVPATRKCSARSAERQACSQLSLLAIHLLLLLR
jgi:hypothetical protein